MSSPQPRVPAAAPGDAPRVALTGASGFLGSSLTRALRAAGSRVHPLTRCPAETPDDIEWDPRTGRIDTGALEGIDALVNLAGEPLARRWTASRKREIRDSRVRGTTLLARVVGTLERPPRVFLSGSAIGYYGSRGDEELDERSSAGSDFLADVAQEWESATEPAARAGIPVTLLRTGVVLNPHGGALAKMLLPFKLGVGGRIGSGRQWMSWISLGDWVRAVVLLLNAAEATGPVNLVGPNPVPNAEFVRTLARVLSRVAVVPLPATLVSVLFGEMGRATLLASQRVHPRRLMEAGFDFESSTLEAALRREE